ncbi:MAG: sulfotransferase domain-containing protein [Planctomycetota bacterium]
MLNVKKQFDRVHARFNMAVLPARDAKIRLSGAITSFRYRPERLSRYDCCLQCCVQRTGSRWLLRVLSDPTVYRYSGLTMQPYPQLPDRLPTRNGERRPPAVRTRSIVGPLYYDYQSFAAVPKPDSYRAVFVLRDPRDIIVSHYFSTRDTHRLNPMICERRHVLGSIDEREGMLKMIEWNESDGMFSSIEGWLNEIEAQPDRLRLCRYEDITGPQQVDFLGELLEFMDVKVPEPDYADLLDRYSLTKMRGGKTGAVVANSHYRSGRSGGWKEKLDDELMERLQHAVGPRVRKLYDF